MKRRLISILLIAVFLTGCSNGVDDSGSNLIPKNGGELRLYSYVPDTLNPLMTGYQCNYDMLCMVYEGLFNVESDFSLSPVLAKRWSSESQNKKYIVTLKEGVTFHDGNKLTALDVVATIDNIIKHDSFYAVNLENVKNYYASGDDRIVFELKESQANFANMLDFPILSKSLKDDDFKEQNEKFIPNGTGMYKYDSVSGQKYLTLKRNDNYHGKNKGYADSIKVIYVKDKETALYSFDVGEVDIIDTSAFSLENYAITIKHNTIDGVSNKYNFVGINHNNTALSNRSVRVAMNYAIDKQKIADDVFYSRAEAVKTPVNPSAYFNASKYDKDDFDVSNAKEILKDDGWLDLDGDDILDKVIDGSKYSLRFNIIVNSDNENRVKIANHIKESLENTGMSIKIVEKDYDSYAADIQSDNYDMFVGGVDIKNDCDLNFMLSKDNLYNYSNDNIDRLLSNIGFSVSPEEIKLNYLNFEEYYIEDYPDIPLCFESFSILRNDRLKGNIAYSRSGAYIGAGNLFVNYK